MNTEWLEYFADTARLGSMRAAAEKHFISPQGLSRSVSVLEKELGVKLFTREANGIQLTPAAELLLPAVHQAVSANQKVNRLASELSAEGQAAKNAVLCSTFVFLCGMLPALRAALEAHAVAGLLYNQMSTDEICNALRRGHGRNNPGSFLLGVPLFFSPNAKDNEVRIAELESLEYSYTPYLRYLDGILVSADHPLATKGAVSKSDLDPYKAISSGAEQLKPLKQYLGAGHVGMEITDMATRLQMILNAKDYIFVPPFLGTIANDDRYRFLTLKDPYLCEVGFIFQPVEGQTLLDIIDLSKLDEYYQPLQERGLCTIVPRA